MSLFIDLKISSIMAEEITYFTSESVTEGHPDKICDQISDAILDAMLKEDPESHCAAECLITKGLVHVAGEVRTNAKINIEEIARETLKKIGYDKEEIGMDHNKCKIINSLQKQSADIAQGVDNHENRLEQGAGDQGLMFGFACNETEELMPLPIILAHQLTERLAEVRKKGIIQGLGPDGKSQVSVKYVNEKPAEITAIVIAQQHLQSLSVEQLRKEIREKVIDPVCKHLMNEETKIHINATGRFVIGGPEADTGLTGRKIIMDTYGGYGRHGGGAFSGKDCSKVDRSAAYMARYVAKNIVAAGFADKCEIQVSYCIGIAKPTSISLNTFGTAKISESVILDAVKNVFDFRPKAIIDHLKLNRPIFNKTASYGHFGRAIPDFTWEKVDKVSALQQACSRSKNSL